MRVLLSLSFLAMLGHGLASRPADPAAPELANVTQIAGPAEAHRPPGPAQHAAEQAAPMPLQHLTSGVQIDGLETGRAAEAAARPDEAFKLLPPLEPDVSYQSWPLNQPTIDALKAGNDQFLPIPTGEWIPFRLRQTQTGGTQEQVPAPGESLATYFYAADEPGILTERDGRWFGTFSHRGEIFLFENQGAGTVIARTQALEQRWLPGLEDARVPPSAHDLSTP